MSRRPSSSSSYFKEPPSPPPDFPNVTEANNVQLPLIQKKLPLSSFNLKSPGPRFSDTADLVVLFCYFLFITVSVVLSAIILDSTARAIPAPTSPVILSLLQRAVAAVSVSITTAMIMVIGKRYVLFKLVREGLRSRKVAVYSNPSIGNLATHMMLHGVELPLFGLSAVWGLAFATSFTVNDSWEIGSLTSHMVPPVLSGPLNTTAANPSYLVSASEELGIVMSSLCAGIGSRQDTIPGLIKVTSDSDLTGTIYYPPPLQWAVNIGYSYYTTINAFNVSMEQLSSVPPTSQNLSCTSSYFSDQMELWYDGSDNQTLSIVVVDSSDAPSVFRLNATAIIVGGTLSSTGDNVEFKLNGTSWPNIMTTGNQWAQDISTLICNATSPSNCETVSTLFDVASLTFYLSQFSGIGSDGTYAVWSSVLNMALGAYSSAVLPSRLSLENNAHDVPVTLYNRVFTARYGVYILIANAIISVVVLIFAFKLRLASRLGSDFINSTRLLLDPLRNPGLFNASLDTTVEALGDPCMLVREGNEFLLVEQKSTGWVESLSLRRPKTIESERTPTVPLTSSDSETVF